MKVRGSLKPGKYTVEPIPNKPGWALARFFENAKEITVEGDDEREARKEWEYDEYQLELIDTGGLATDIDGNFDVYFQAAKEQDPEIMKAKVEKPLKDLNEQIDNAMLAMCDVYEMMLGGDV